VTGIYYPELLDVLRAAGCQVAESSTTDGWQTRARSSGGFPSPPLGVWWHHTASSTSPSSDLGWMIDGSDDAPIGNLLLDRSGTFWPIAAGASNCAGKGGPWTFSRGVCPVDSGNTRGWQLEVANNGVGEPWPVVQVDAFVAGSNALNAHVGNLPTDVVTHQAYAPTRKVDPATADAVEGPWRPSSSTSSGTWNLDDVRSECSRRAGTPTPLPPDDDEDDMTRYLVQHPGPGPNAGAWLLTDTATYATRVPYPGSEKELADLRTDGVRLFGWKDDGDGPWLLGPQWAELLDELLG